MPRAVADAMTDYLLHHNANTHWRYPTSQETDAMIEGAREALADFLGADPAEVAFGANMTTLTFHLARALGRGWGPGDEIVVTELDHHANVAPWRALERERGVTVRTVPMIPETGQLDWAALEQALVAEPRLLAIGAASNALGTITDVARAAAMARDAGRAHLRGRGPLRAARAGGRAGARLRLPRLLRLQVLRPARRRALRPVGAARRAWTSPSWSPPRRRRPSGWRRAR